MLDPIPLLEPVIALAKQAGAAILAIYRQARQCNVQTKPDHSPLTQADLMSNEVLSLGLTQLKPTLPYLSEEGASIPWTERQTWPYYWLVDPLDGTREFLKHSGEFVVSIALIEQHSPILGILYIPITGECYYACKGQGAYKLDPLGNRQALHVRHWQANQTLLLMSQAAREERIQHYFGNLGKLDMIRMSSAWKFCKIAQGSADLSPRLGDTSEWDTAAGQCILEEAGGALVNLHAEPLRYNTKDSLLNPFFIALGDAAALREKINWRALP